MRTYNRYFVGCHLHNNGWLNVCQVKVLNIDKEG
nr:MAG TPA: hypothetical protein [Caudoviricetes sp.]